MSAHIVYALPEDRASADQFDRWPGMAISVPLTDVVGAVDELMWEVDDDRDFSVWCELRGWDEESVPVDELVAWWEPRDASRKEREAEALRRLVLEGGGSAMGCPSCQIHRGGLYYLRVADGGEVCCGKCGDSWVGWRGWDIDGLVEAILAGDLDEQLEDGRRAAEAEAERRREWAERRAALAAADGAGAV